MNKTSGRYILAGTMFSILWASAASAGKIGLLSVEGLVLFTVRFIAAGLLLLAYATFVQKDRFPQKNEWLPLAVFGVFNTTLYLGIFIIALRDVTAGITSIAVALNPLLISAMTALWLRKPVSRMEWISILIGIAGVIVASYPLLINSYATPIGLFLLATSMVAYSFGSVYYATVPWKLSRTSINGWQAFIGGVLLIPPAWIFHTNENHFDTRFLFATLWLVVPVSIGAIQLWLYLLKSDAVKASIWLFLCPIFGLIIATVLLDEPFTIHTIAGTILVLIALVLGQRSSLQKSGGASK